jgi:hypothetical protein
MDTHSFRALSTIVPRSKTAIGARQETYYGFCCWGKGSVGGGGGVLISQIAQMPGPDETLSEDNECADHNRQANGGRGMADVVSRAEQQNQDDIAEPT